MAELTSKMLTLSVLGDKVDFLCSWLKRVLALKSLQDNPKGTGLTATEMSRNEANYASSRRSKAAGWSSIT